MKVVEIFEKQEDEYNQVPEKKLSNSERYKLLAGRGRGYHHQLFIIRAYERTALKSLHKKGKITNSDDPAWLSMTDEEKVKYKYIPNMGSGAYYVLNTPENKEFATKLIQWIEDKKEEVSFLQARCAEIDRRLKGLRTAATRMRRAAYRTKNK